MNLNNIGQKICIIKKLDEDGEYMKPKKGDEQIISITDEPERHKRINFFNEMKLEEGEKFQLYPDKAKERHSLYICGMNGSGKSYFIRNYILEWIKIYPKMDIYLFSSKNEDKSLDSIKQIKRVKIDESFINNKMNYEDLYESLVLFDDIDAFRGELKKEIYHLRDIIYKNARSYKISIISTSHDLCGIENKTALKESENITFFLKGYNKPMKYFLESYCGLDKDGIKTLRKNKTRSTTFIKTNPPIFLQDRNIISLSELIKD